MEDFKHFERPTTEKPGTIVSAVIVSALIGLVTGAAGFTIMKQIYPADVLVVNEGGTTPIRFNINDPLIHLSSAFVKYNASIYSPVNGTDVYSQLFSQANYLGSGVVVTSDGWIMLTPGAAISSGQQFVAYIDGKVYKGNEVRTDKRYKLIFVKVEATNLQPVNFSTNQDLVLGASLVYNHTLVGNQPMFNKTSIAQLDVLDTSSKASQIEFSDSQINPDLVTDIYQGEAPSYFTLDGSLAGLAFGQKQFIPAPVLEKIVAKMLNQTDYVNLGVYYLDLSRIEGDEQGLMVFNPQASAVVYNSPAYLAGIKSGDVITMIDGREIKNSTAFKLLLAGYNRGDQVVFSIDRDQETLDLTVKF